MAKATKTTVKDRKLQLVEHLINVGWKPNHEWIGSFKDNEVDFEKLILGKLGSDCHLVSHCGCYTVRIKSTHTTFWQKDPKWMKLLNCPIKDIKLTNNGIQVGIVHIIIEQQEIEEVN